MRIGILTFHCAHNYGAVLQCYALQTFLEQRGHDVHIIDYRPKVITDVYKWFKTRLIIRKNLYKAAKEVLLLTGKKKRYDAFCRFSENHLRLAPLATINDSPYDMILVGSDQVWNYHLTNGFDHYYWGDFNHPATTRVASYAASMHDNWTVEESRHIAKLLKNFSKISVRESALANKLKYLTGREDIYQVADPTLLIDSNIWRTLATKPKTDQPYLLLFQVEGHNSKTEAIAQEMARRKNLKIVHLFTFADWGTTWSVMSTSPTDFLGLFLYADFVVCSSFHGTVFCLHFRKPFVSVRMGVGKDNRVANLLEYLGLSDHFIDTLPCDYDGCFQLDEGRLNSLRQKSVEYILNIEND